MGFNQKIYETLEFSKIKHQVKQYVQTERGGINVEQMRPLTNLEKVRTLQAETEQSLAILMQQKQLPIPRLPHLEQALKRLEMGASLNGLEIAHIGKLLKTTQQMQAFFDQLAKEEKVYPALSYWVHKCVVLPQVEKIIAEAISEDGSVLSSASIQLATIRRQQQQTEQQVRTVLNDLLKNKASLLTDTLITIRNERYVLPVKVEYRTQFGGTVHDQSSTGQTLYIEPQAAVQLNNKRAELQVAERKEIERILAEISATLMPYHEDIRQNEYLIAQLDFIQARAHYAKLLNATKPSFNEQQHVALWQARHPLIDATKVVANDIVLGESYQSLIITGPNTGGKTILLKTLGLLQLMGQSGLHIPCESGSRLGIFDDVFADIGDEQSIEQSLSTFSSHMTNIVRILNHATAQSLVLFDELGSGTDPQEGAALAMAILNHTRKIGCLVMATTHYPELKVYAHNAANTINASMEFDHQTLSPTYRLLIGVPGRSNALDISKRLGLQESILEEAREGISEDSQSLNEMVAKLERERREAELNHADALERLATAEQLYQDLRTEYDRWLDKKAELLEKAKREANEKVEAAQKEAAKLIQEIRDLQLEQGQNKHIKEHVLIEKKSAFEQLKQAETLKKNKVLQKAKANRTLKVGDDVEVLSYGQRGTIIEVISKDEYIVQIGILKLSANQADLSPLAKLEPQAKINVQRRAGSKVQTTLDLRGERYEQAMYRLNHYLDAALLSHHPMVTIIHGKGTGALREGVRQTLKRHPKVERFEYSLPNAGGDGSTVVHFK
ncbi:MAG: endonuclease MutS2 [Aerococcaceae bacterium]|nr:endonuclease MutS2 [Aerococcaceae bacterium]